MKWKNAKHHASDGNFRTCMLQPAQCEICFCLRSRADHPLVHYLIINLPSRCLGCEPECQTCIGYHRLLISLNCRKMIRFQTCLRCLPDLETACCCLGRLLGHRGKFHTLDIQLPAHWPVSLQRPNCWKQLLFYQEKQEKKSLFTCKYEPGIAYGACCKSCSTVQDPEQLYRHHPVTTANIQMESWTDNKMGDEKVSIAPAAKKQGFESCNSRNQLATSGHWEARVGSRMSRTHLPSWTDQTRLD